MYTLRDIHLHTSTRPQIFTCGHTKSHRYTHARLHTHTHTHTHNQHTTHTHSHTHTLTRISLSHTHSREYAAAIMAQRAQGNAPRHDLQPHWPRRHTLQNSRPLLQPSTLRAVTANSKSCSQVSETSLMVHHLFTRTYVQPHTRTRGSLSCPPEGSDTCFCY